MDEIDWLSYKHTVLNPIARMHRVISENIDAFRGITKFETTLLDENLKVTVIVEKYNGDDNYTKIE